MNRTARAPKPILEVKNWERLQHYGVTRDAPWIKLYARLLDDVDGFLELAETTQAHLAKIWLLALRNKNKIPFRLEWIEFAISARSKVDFETLIGDGWLIPMHVSTVEIDAAIEQTRARPLPASIVRYHESLASEEKRREEQRSSKISVLSGSGVPTPARSALGAAGREARAEVGHD